EPFKSFSSSATPIFSNPMPKEAMQSFEKQQALSKIHEDKARRLFQAGQYAQAQAECHLAIARSGKMNNTPANTRAYRVDGRD
ncbi:MAG: hypothetical protein JWN98_2131, partial [Abditibacteriota bacterium]|nr:hypothetical protein [Abditibacteriota bacterium]